MKRQQNKKCLSQLDETADYFFIGNRNMNFKGTGIVEEGAENVRSHNANHSAADSGSEIFRETLENKIRGKVK